MKKILIATEKPFAQIAVDGIKAIIDHAGYEFALLENYTDKADLLKAVVDADALIIRSDIVDAEVVDAAKQLKIVVRAGAGYDNIDLTACTNKHIIAMNTPGQNSNAVAELAIGMMIYYARGCFNGKSGSELLGKTIGIHAYGNVGKHVARIAKGMGMIVYAFDPFIDKKVMEADGIIVTNSVEELYSKSQYVSLHIPATAETKNSIGYNLLMKMPKGAVLVNTARKEVINEGEMLKVFTDRKDFGYISDIEPACLNELKEHFAGRFYCTPKKMGAQTEEANINAGLAAANQIVDFFEKGDVRFKVN